ncbi:MAG: protein translocase subunit SecD [Alphaproteobacteria bacterium]|jgi:preprotein translocase subunit SecD|nr:protein translocase subunit SecD [Alphaproteobacteria bacterium]MBT4018218.1 protein translocase subunit SecD [Alphaproteobacteria bacterium]MBT4966351.1 protein translocase subunit SecD [Alphaproteobacteria bacterium]MBT5160789.1 protein translocase subunit SecD [Alphaproteobacteria bacterium]MBT6384376.1 protein translocase subunit SecD [Alphaproteobacteria bacterium]
MLYFSNWKITLIALVSAAGILFTLPNFLDRSTAEGLPDWVPHKQINLGLDLQGGSHLLLEVDTDAVVLERLENLVEGARADLRKERIGYSGGLGVTDGSKVLVRVRKPEQMEKAQEIVNGLGNVMTPNAMGQGGGRDIEVEVLDGNVLQITMTEQAILDRKRAAVEQSIEIVRRRIDQTGTREPTIQRQGDDRILIQLPGVKDPDRIKRLLGKTAKMVFRFVDIKSNVADVLRTGRVPPGSELLEQEAKEAGGSARQYLVRKRVMVSGESLVDADATFDQGRPVVSFRFDSVGAKKFADATSKNVGRLFAIVLDNKVISAPEIQSPILGGSGIISGSFTVPEANDLAVLLRAGALPAPLKILEERTVGPDLGADSIRAGKIASGLAFIIVMVFMAMFYGRFGFAADAALLVNMALIGGALSILQATLTLPGIAGIVLTIGMAVDANVLIFERIKEEARLGKTPFAAVDAGYKRALTTIIDANVTTLIAAVLLLQFGSGPVKGFAWTLAIGVVTSMFTAVTLTRLLVALWLRRARPTQLPI